MPVIQLFMSDVFTPSGVLYKEKINKQTQVLSRRSTPVQIGVDVVPWESGRRADDGMTLHFSTVGCSVVYTTVDTTFPGRLMIKDWISAVCGVSDTL